MEQKLITEIHKDVIRLNTQAFHPKKYIRRRVIRKNLPRLRGLVVDIGCGRGEDPPFMTGASRIIGYDLDAEILKYYSRRNSLPAVAGDATDMPLRDGCVDSLSCIDVLEHIPDYRKTISESCRVLKRGGMIIVSVPTNPNLFTEKDKEIGHIRLFVPERLVNDMKEAGFRIETVKKYGALIYPYVKYLSNKMSVKKIHSMQQSRLFVLFKIVFNLFIKLFLNLDYYFPQVRDVGMLVVAVKQ